MPRRQRDAVAVVVVVVPPEEGVRPQPQTVPISLMTLPRLPLASGDKLP